MTLSALVPLTLASILFGQSDLTSVTGTIHDPSGAVVANANVTVKNQATGAERKATTTTSGTYSIPTIPAGAYTLIIEAAGFKRFEQAGNVFQANVAATLDATLTVGSATETVQVTSEAPPVQADSATLGRDVTTKQIRDLQLNGRNPYLLSLLEPGVTGGTIGGFSFGLNNGLNVNGARNQDTLITQDGAPAVRTRSNGTSIGVADADATQEVQILTSNYNAEYGRASGGQIRIVTKSGTRDFHGTAYEYFRNNALDANSWSRNNSPDPALNSQAAPFRFNQFGYNVGGPVFIPKHWNTDRSKIFFMFGQEYVRYRLVDQNSLTSSQFVPSLAMRQGDFSELLNPSNPFYGKVRTITDPTTGAPFPNNVIPQNRLSHNGTALLNMFPLPDRTGALNYQQTAPHPINQRKDSAALDYLPAQNHYIRFRTLNYEYSETIPFASNYYVIPQSFSRPNQTVSLGWTWNISPTVVNEFLATASRDQVYINIDQSNGLYDRNRYGINYPFLFPTGKNIPNKIPSVALNGPFNELSGLPYPSASKGPIYDISDNVTKITGNHTLKAGFLFERSGENDYDQINIQGVPGGSNNQNGRFVFLDSTPNGTGLSVANAALGLFDTYAELGVRSYTPYRGFMYEWFAQDSWKITPKLHIDYGLRQSIIIPYYSIWRNMSVFDPTYYNPATAVKVDPTTGRPIAGSGNPYDGLVIPGSGFPAAAHGRVAADPYPSYDPSVNGLFRNISKSYSQVHPLQGMQPRIGVAYALNEKTAIRAGVGRYLTRLGVSDSVFLGGNPPFQPSASVSYGRVDSPGGGAQNTFPLPVTTQDPIFYNPEAWSWNAAVQRDIGFSTTLEVAYVGRRGLRGQQELNINQLQPGTTFANPGVSPDALRPYAGYGAIRSTNNVSNSIYHALQVNVNRRLTKGLLFGLAYTWSKSMDFGSNQRDVLPNAFNRYYQYGFSDYDHRHVAVINFIYELPFYRDTKSLTGKLLGGWQISEITQLQTGSPVSAQTNDDFAGVGPGSGNSGSGNNGFSSRWIVNGNIAQPAQFGAGGQWYAFQTGVNILKPAQGTFTNQRSRNIFYQPGFQNWNLGVFKNFYTTESQYITMRFEVFNWLNHPNWGGA
ncbi:MAG: carboxypeptidase regulatory-like domain-containing protein, partial [Acidobacteriaceae bacterium]|nr:carboxypeptidase regulatory-like domain-containing protein [Acidobacteriaceae bacterium]